ncbi:MAG: discoidin domain-containing protein [Planctomycetaceae bacterium]|nr:discoidin domain-containing protein [Planctomycetaceae bacterium]
MPMNFGSQMELPSPASSNKEVVRKQEFDAGLANKQDKAPTGGANAGKTFGVKDGLWTEILSTSPSGNFVTTDTAQTITGKKTWFGDGAVVVQISTDNIDTTFSGAEIKVDYGDSQYVSIGHQQLRYQSVTQSSVLSAGSITFSQGIVATTLNKDYLSIGSSLSGGRFDDTKLQWTRGAGTYTLNVSSSGTFWGNVTTAATATDAGKIVILPSGGTSSQFINGLGQLAVPGGGGGNTSLVPGSIVHIGSGLARILHAGAVWQMMDGVTVCDFEEFPQLANVNGLDRVTTLNSVISPMTSNNSAGQTASCSTVYHFTGNNDAFHAFDSAANTFWCSNNTNIYSGGEEWLQMDFGQPTPIDRYTLSRTYNGGDGCSPPSDWRLKGSSDGTNWTDIDVQIGCIWSTSNTHEFNIAPTSFRYYRLVISKFYDPGSYSSGYVALADFSLFNQQTVTATFQQLSPLAAGVNPYMYCGVPQ